MKTTVKIHGTDFPIRHLFFLCLGIFLGFYILFPFKGSLSEYDSFIFGIALFFGFIYFFAYLVMGSCLVFLKWVFMKLFKKKTTPEIEKSNEIHKGAEQGAAVSFDIFIYYLGGLIGVILIALCTIISAVGLGLFHLIKFLSNSEFLFQSYVLP